MAVALGIVGSVLAGGWAAHALPPTPSVPIAAGAGGRVATDVVVTPNAAIGPDASRTVPTTVPAASPSPAQGSSTLTQTMVLEILPGSFSWTARPASTPDSGVRLFEGDVRYAIGDGGLWTVTATVTGGEGAMFTPACALAPDLRGNPRAFGSTDFESVVPGPPVLATGSPVTVTLCQALRAPTGGTWEAWLDADREIGGSVVATIALDRVAADER